MTRLHRLRARTSVALLLCLSAAAHAATRTSEQMRSDEIWLESLTSGLQKWPAMPSAYASATTRPYARVSFAYDRTNIAHVSLQEGLSGIRIHVSAGWLTLAEDDVLAELLSRQKGLEASGCVDDYLAAIHPALATNRRFEDGEVVLPVAVPSFGQFVRGGGAPPCRGLQSVVWSGEWRTQWPAVRQRVEAGLLWWALLDLRCRARMPCEPGSLADDDATRWLQSFGFDAEMAAPLKRLRFEAFK